MVHDLTRLPADLPVPIDDGGAWHLFGARLPKLALTSTGESEARPLAELTAGRAVLFFYPRTGVPGQPPSRGFGGEEWDEIPGARGCTPQSCGFRDLHARFAGLGVAVYGVSTSTPGHQAEFVRRMHIPFAMLSDSELRLVRAMSVPTFEFPVESGGPSTLIRRMAWYVEGSVVHRAWYPVFPPDQNAATVLAWLERRGRLEIHPTREADLAFVREELRRHWISMTIWSRDHPFEADVLPGFIAEADGAPVGLITLAFQQDTCEVVTLSSRIESRGVGSSLLAVAINAARERGCARVILTTSNDNLRALGFYQRRGFRLVAIHREIIDRYRDRQREIPRMGAGVPIRDEVELEYRLGAR